VGPGRLHALIDGVFAIAITLLVLDLPRPQSSQHLAHDLVHVWPTYVAYGVSFATLGVVWIEHHGMMSGVRAIDRRLLERTLVFLLFVSIIPWPTALAASYADQGSQALPAAVLYAGTMMMMGLTFAWGWSYLDHHRGLVVDAAVAGLPIGYRRGLVGGLAYLVAIGVAFIDTWASFAIDAAIAVYFAVSASPVPGLLLRAARDEPD
jgi:uncharacterized membrane protein